MKDYKRKQKDVVTKMDALIVLVIFGIIPFIDHMSLNTMIMFTVAETLFLIYWMAR